MQKGNTLITLLVVIGILLLGGGIAFFLTQSQNNQPAMTKAPIREEIYNEMTETEFQTSTDAADMDNMEADVTIEISGKNFEYNTDEITVKKGEKVKIVFTAESGIHDFVIDEFNAKTDQVSEGEVSEVTFVADQAGEFEFYCSVGNHRQMGMVGTFIVEE